MDSHAWTALGTYGDASQRGCEAAAIAPPLSYSCSRGRQGDLASEEEKHNHK